MLLKTTIKQKHLPLLNLNAHQEQDTEILKTTIQVATKTILIPLPRSYGINFGNHISPWEI